MSIAQGIERLNSIVGKNYATNDASNIVKALGDVIEQFKEDQISGGIEKTLLDQLSSILVKKPTKRGQIVLGLRTHPDVLRAQLQAITGDTSSQFYKDNVTNAHVIKNIINNGKEIFTGNKTREGKLDGILKTIKQNEQAAAQQAAAQVAATEAKQKAEDSFIVAVPKSLVSGV